MERRDGVEVYNLTQSVTVLDVSEFDGKAAQYFAVQHGLITSSQIVEAGGSVKGAARRCRDGSWQRMHRGLYRLSGAPTTDLQRALAAVLGAPFGAVAWGSTAAALHGLPGFSLQPIRIAVGDFQRTHQHGASVRHTSTLPPHHTTTVFAIPTTTVARTLVDIAAVHHERKVARALDDAIAMKRVTVAQCQLVLNELAQSGRNGVRLIRRLLDDRCDGAALAESVLELQFEALLTSHGIEVPQRQVNINADGTWLGRLDYRLSNGQLVEVDSRRHHTALLDYERDLAINNSLLATGQAPPLRITYRMMRDRPAEVARLLRRAAQLPPHPAFPQHEHDQNGP